MKVLDPGHRYAVETYSIDGKKTGEGSQLVFSKRPVEGLDRKIEECYPGTNIQEVVRVLIDRIKELDKECPTDCNLRMIELLRKVLFELEERAFLRKEQKVNGTTKQHRNILHFLPEFDDNEIENLPTREDGHLVL